MELKRICPYPVGEIRFSVDSTDPSEIWPGTAWERIEGRFLLAATDGGNDGASQAAGNTGGEAAHKLTSAECGTPGLGHSVTQPAFRTPNLSHSVTQPAFTLPNHVHTMTHGHGAPLGGNSGTTKLTSSYGSYGGTDSSAWGPWWGSGWSAKDNVSVPNYTGNSGDPTSNPACSRSTNVGVSDHAAADCTRTGNVGVADHAAANAASAHNNMPPYLSVYVWKRTS